MQQSEKMPIRMVAKRAGVTTYTINFYVQQGLLPPPEKLSRTRALYSEEHIEWLEVIRRLQELGYPLQMLKRALDHFGHSRETLQRLREGGILQPIPTARSEADEFQEQPGPPMVLGDFTKATGLSDQEVHQLEAWGVLRPRAPGRYDLSDLELAKMVKRVLDQGIPIHELAFYQDFIPLARRFAAVGYKLIERDLEAVRKHEVHVRDVGRPLFRILDYLIFRVSFERSPNVNDLLLGEASGPERSGLEGREY